MKLSNADKINNINNINKISKIDRIKSIGSCFHEATFLDIIIIAVI